MSPCVGKSKWISTKRQFITFNELVIVRKNGRLILSLRLFGLLDVLHSLKFCAWIIRDHRLYLLYHLLKLKRLTKTKYIDDHLLVEPVIWCKSIFMSNARLCCISVWCLMSDAICWQKVRRNEEEGQTKRACCANNQLNNNNIICVWNIMRFI